LGCQAVQEEIDRYIKFYNNQRAHQSLWNFTPNQVYELNSKIEILKILKKMKLKSRSGKSGVGDRHPVFARSLQASAIRGA